LRSTETAIQAAFKDLLILIGKVEKWFVRYGRKGDFLPDGPGYVLPGSCPVILFIAHGICNLMYKTDGVQTKKARTY
jgi:hypothetical protein